jgi:serine/threonine-protein kinase RsbW
MTSPEPETPIPVQLTIPADARWLTVVRLAVSGVASRLGASYEDVDDIKVAVSEACTNAIDHAFEDRACGEGTICIRCQPGEGELRIDVQDQGRGFDLSKAEVVDDADPGKRGGLGLFLIQRLMDEAEVVSRPGGGTRVTMVKRFAR